MKIVSIAISQKKGTPKTPVIEARVRKGHGLERDAHAGPWHRQISFLAAESIKKAKKRGLDVGFGAFAENIATIGVDWQKVPVGTCLELGESAVVEITQIGKTCHKKCAVFYQAGDCIMPKEGIFGRVLKGGNIRVGDAIRILPKKPILTEG
jgi:MOSC domain-containing protein YiiM